MIDDGNCPSIDIVSDGYVERQKIRDLTNRVNEMYRSESRSELLREAVREAIKDLPPLPYVCHTPRNQ